jgi:hypothetical protein
MTQMSDRTKNILINISIVIGSILITSTICLVGLEIYLRLFVEDDYRFQLGEKRIYCKGPHYQGKYHPVYGWTQHPNAVYFQKRASFSPWLLYKYNDMGFRDTYDQGDEQVLVFGDSFMEGFPTGDSTTVPALLDRWTPGTRFKSFGMGGYGTTQELLVYRDVEEDYPHKFVVLWYHFNDPADHLHDDPRRPRFGLKDGELIQTNKPSRKYPFRLRPRLKPIKIRLENWTESFPYLLVKLKSLKNSVMSLWNNPDDGSANDGNPPPKLDYQMRLAERLLEAFYKQAQSNDAPLLVALKPARDEFKERRTALVNRTYEMMRSLDKQYDEFIFLDLLTHFNRLDKPLTSYYGKQSSHFNPEGYRKTAQFIHERMLQMNVIEKKPTLDYDKPEVQTYSDPSCSMLE